jgi:hypothetical protein
MAIYFSRLTPGQTRYGIFQNLFDRDDRATVGGWYLHIHCAPFQLELYGRNTR